MEDAAVAEPVGAARGAGLDGVESSLRAEPWSFSFFQAVRLLERLHRDREPVGHFREPDRETVKFSANPDIGFPASEIQGLDTAGSAAPAMTVNFLGLIGPQGVLPYWYSLAVQDQLRARSTALRSFLDIFQHRILSHFYRAWAKPRFIVEHERGGQDILTRLVAATVGARAGQNDSPHEMRRRVLLFYAGLFGPHRRSAIALEQLLSDFFGVHAVVEQYVGGWYAVPDESRSRVGEGADSTTALGLGALVGDEVWDPQVRARIHLGPLTREQFAAFLPTGPAHAELRELARLFSGDEVDFEVRLVLKADEVPRCVLGGTDAGALGWTTWLRTMPLAHDAGDTTLTL